MQLVKAVLLASSLVSAIPAFANWERFIETKRQIMGEAAYVRIHAQYAAYRMGKSPTIAHPMIQAIPIVEGGGKLVDLRTIQNDRVTPLPNPSVPLESPGCNAGFTCSLKMREGLYEGLCTTIQYLDLLAPHFGYEPGQISIKVFEGVRDLETQQGLFDRKMHQIAQERPLLRPADLLKETEKWVSPVQNNVPTHSTGGAVDIRLWDNKNKAFLDLGFFGVIWGDNFAAPTFAEDLTEEQKNNRLLLLIAATQADLVNYSYEYWHFSQGDRYAKFWSETQPIAVYASVTGN